jgi:hypothetical protein
MQACELALSSFVTIEPSWPADDVSRLIATIKPTHVLVHRGEPPQDRYWLLESGAVLAELAGARAICDALRLDEADAAALVDAHADAKTMPDRCVIHDEGSIIGFFDSDYLPAPGDTRRTMQGASGAEQTSIVRKLSAAFPSEVEVGSSTSLLVSIGGAIAGTPDLPVAVPAGTILDIVVQPRRGFEIEALAEGQLEAGEIETLPLQFKVRATAIGPGELRVLAFHNGQALGALTLRSLVVAAGRARTSGSHERAASLAPASVRMPDMMLLIEERRIDGKPGFITRLTAPYLEKPHNLTLFGPVVLQADASKYFDGFFADIESLRLDTAEDRAIAQQKLRDKGANLFERVFPPELRSVLWELRNRNLSMLVQSEEAWIPWELCRLVGGENGEPADGPFLCEAFRLTRWKPGVSFKLPLDLTHMAVVVPSDSGLPVAPLERDAILELAGNGRKVDQVAANFLDLQRALASGRYGAWHFTGHGLHCTSDPNRAVMILERRQTFTPENLAGEVRRLGRARPLVFLNACQTGRPGMSLTGIGGWANEFLASGAGAFIGTYWSVFDTPAFDFAATFYAHLLTGEAMGEAVQSARAKIKNTGDPTCLAYTVYADPTACIVRSDAQRPAA